MALTGQQEIWIFGLIQNYQEANKEKICADVEGMKIPILHLNHLVLSKITNNRTKDKLDLEELQKIQRLKNKE